MRKPVLPEALLFDYGDTLMRILWRGRKHGIEAVLEHAVEASMPKVDRSSLVETLVEIGRGLDFRFEALCARNNLEYRQLDFHRLLYGKYGITFTIDEEELEWIYWSAALEMEPEPGLESFLTLCRERGVRMAVISNTSFRGMILERELRLRKLDHYFELVMASADFGIRKPDPLLYEIALKRMNVTPDRTAYVGNLTTVDCAGAAAAGMIPIWYAASDIREGRFEREVAKIPEGSLTCRSWAECGPVLFP